MADTQIDLQPVIEKLDKVADLLQDIQIKRAGDVSGTNTRLDYIENHLRQVDTLVREQAEMSASVKTLTSQLGEVKSEGTDREIRLRSVEEISKANVLGLKVVADKSLVLEGKTGTLERWVSFAIGGLALLQLFLSPAISSLIQRLFN